MLTLEITAIEQHNRFIKRVIDTGEIWALTTNGNYIFSESNEEEDRTVFTVWSDRAYAQRCAIKEWTSYIPASIPLAEFLEAWCAGLNNNQELVGTNWDTELRGLEIEPLALALEILESLKSTDKNLFFNSYSNIAELETAINQVIAKSQS